ncbi:PREDICTED: uncharacterized protein LOC104601105 [Nelumbo nucifera]|uniref:Uncharacterized protein LOC104601105 n=2 Tax=Nelumbo nucifera TaxID=4432 RepID=A0A1U8AJB2_NELNU|nr:PREDICTED: uncharacterized protein LOC104601105 [Nelumbo nucifera]DAD28290.1 TPA_asm: hypothetical protein HUJ06_029758 [Nelumbo nucifera]
MPGGSAMERGRYWTWTKVQECVGSHIQPSTASLYNDSWEEQAFAVDSAGHLGGCIWPPRSYTCSFCRREFRSAQALGGHMNVHRRDRARLKQSPTSHDEILHHHHQTHYPDHQNPCTSLGVQYPSQLCTLVYSPNPNSNPGVVSSSKSTSRVSAPSTQENCSEQALVSPSYSSSTVQQHRKGSLLSPPPSWSDSVAVKVLALSDAKIEGEKIPITQESGCRVSGDYAKPDLAVSLNLVVHRNRSPGTSAGDDDDDQETISRKRKRTDTSTLPFFLEPSSVDLRHLQSEVLGVCPGSMEDLDLELRLGRRPKVK